MMLLISKEMQTEIDFIYNLYKKGFVGIEELQKNNSFFRREKSERGFKKKSNEVKHD